MPRRPRRPTLFPYTTLFRSGPVRVARHRRRLRPVDPALEERAHVAPGNPRGQVDEVLSAGRLVVVATHPLALEALELRGRSEEHTSELQSQSNLVCRLLLEK